MYLLKMIERAALRVKLTRVDKRQETTFTKCYNPFIVKLIQFVFKELCIEAESL